MENSVILFSTADWDNPFWTNKQHTAVQLAELGYQVLYIESLGLRQPQLKSADLTRIFKRLKKAMIGLRHVKPKLSVYSPLVLPFHRYSLVRRFNAWLLHVTLLRQMKKLGMTKPWVWTYNPMVFKLAQGIGYSKLIYHSVDDLAAAPGVDAVSILSHEAELLKNADVVFCTSRKIEAHCKKVAGDKVHFFGNVVDYDHFSKAKTALPEPSDLKTIPHPRIGFVGALSSYKFDVEAVKAVVLKRPEWQWVLVGKIGEGQPDSEMEALKELPNLHFLGPKPYAELPTYLTHFDVTIIPCPLNDYTQSMFPMKFFEYMAAGKPIVARDIDSLKEHQEVFYPYRNAHELEQQIECALNFGVKNQALATELAQENTWAKRMGKMLDLIRLI